MYSILFTHRLSALSNTLILLKAVHNFNDEDHSIVSIPYYTKMTRPIGMTAKYRLSLLTRILRKTFHTLQRIPINWSSFQIKKAMLL